MDYAGIEARLTADIDLPHRPVAVAFRQTAPPGIDRFEGSQPSGCSYWKLASEGRVFYTVAADHYNCPIGSYTHRIDLPEERAHELSDTLGLMTQVGYLRMEEVPSIPRLSEAPGVVVYAPLGATPIDPDVVLFWGPPGRVMVLQEAAIRAGIAANFNALARPTCMVLPAALSSGTSASTGCVGNRVYTELSESELYVAVPGRDLARLAADAAVVRTANDALLAYHQERRQQLARA